MNDQIREMELSEYPLTLQNMPGVPKKLYIRGRLADPVAATAAQHRYVCVVGSRRSTRYGRDSIGKILSGLRGYPVSIVSGLAIGIDSIAHMAALDAGLHCIAFPGSTLEWGELYPQSHIRLAQRIIEQGGALLSRWKSGYPTAEWAFPERNKLMAGISHATLIVEAGLRSGSLMTAEHAEKYNRDVFAIPGPINAALSYGPHMLIKSGAALISSPNDLLRELGFPVSRPSAGPDWKKADLDSRSSRIMGILSFEEITMDHLIEKADMPLPELNSRLSELELGGFIKIEPDVVRII